jgi:hypothetical protein
MKLGTSLRISVLLAFLCASSAPASAQEGFHTRGGSRGETRATASGGTTLDIQKRWRARDLAFSTAEEALNWGDKQAAVRALSQAADLLWADYPERSGEWLTRAWEMTGTVSDEDADAAVRRFRSDSPRAGARATVLTVAQKHDPLLADRLLAQLVDEKDQSQAGSRRGVFDDRTARSEQLLDVALAVAESDPAGAAGLAVRSLADGISFQLQSLLLELRRRDAAAADRVFDATLDRLANGFTDPSEGQVLASYLFTPGRVVGAGTGRTRVLAVGTQAPVPARTPAEDDPARARRFLAVMQRVLLSMPVPSSTANPSQAAQEFITLSGSLAGGYKLYAPDMWPAVEQRMRQALPRLAPAGAGADNGLPLSVREKLRSGEAAGADEKELHRLYLDGLEEAAEKEFDPTARGLALVQAALATTPEELGRGRKIADRINDGDLREQVISFLVYRTALLDLERGRPEEAVGLAAEAKPVQRAIVLITAAQRVTAERFNADKGRDPDQKLRALEWLSEAGKLLKRDDLPSAGLRARLGLVAALAPLDAAHALEAFDDAVAAINKDASFDAFDNSAPRIADLTGSSGSLLPRIRGGFGIRDAVRPLARADFEGTFTVVAKLGSPSVRGACTLEVAQSVLSSDSTK